MTKKASIVIITILLVLVLFLGVFSFVPPFDVGAYKVYYSPVNLIQKGTSLTDKFAATYLIDGGDLESDEYTNAVNNATSIINKRLGNVFGYYNIPLTVNESKDRISITIPTTTAHDGTKEGDIVSNTMVVGKVELLLEQTYDETKVIMSNYGDKGYFKSASTSQFVRGTNTYYIVEVGLTAKGLEFANENLTHSSSAVSAYCAIDGVASYQVAHTSTVNKIQIYVASTAEAKMLASFFNYGMLDVKLEQVDTDIIANNDIVSLVMGLTALLLIVAMCVFFVVRYGVLGIAGILSTLISVVAVVIFMGLAYFGMFNLYAFIGFLLGLGIFAYCNIVSLESVRSRISQIRKISTAINSGFNKSWLRVLIVAGCAMVVGIILWLIPTAVTASLGNALVYCAIMSLITALGVTRLLTMAVAPLGNGNVESYGVKGA